MRRIRIRLLVGMNMLAINAGLAPLAAMEILQFPLWVLFWLSTLACCIVFWGPVFEIIIAAEELDKEKRKPNKNNGGTET